MDTDLEIMVGTCSLFEVWISLLRYCSLKKVRDFSPTNCLRDVGTPVKNWKQTTQSCSAHYVYRYGGIFRCWSVQGRAIS